MYRLNIFLGDLSKNFPTTVNIASAPIFNKFAAAIPNPWRMKYEMKKFEAFGRFSARRVVALAGSSTMEDTTAAAPEAKVVTRKTWIT